MNTDWIGYWSHICGGKTAIITAGDRKQYAYSVIDEKSRRLNDLMSSKYKIGAGDRVCIIAENRIEYIYLLSWAQKSGAILVPLNYRLTKFEISILIQDAQASLIIYEEQFSHCLPDSLDTSRLHIEQLEEYIEAYDGSSNKLDPPNLEQTALLLYTSGSTGIPKAVKYTHEMMFWNSINTSVCLGLSAQTITLVCMPPFHTGGWNVLLTPVLHHGGICILMKKFDAREVLNILSEYKCTQFMGVPTMLRMMADTEEFERLSFDALEYILVGGEAMPLKLIEKYNKKGIAIRQGYGMTEVGPNITSLHQDDSLRKIGSIGKPNLYTDLCLKDPEGNIVGHDERGELCFRGPLVTPGYWNNPEATRNTIYDGWLHSGDVAIMDDEGFIYIVDRIKNMFISGGENVYPAEVEKLILEFSGVSEVVVVGVPDDKWGEVGKAFIVVSSPDITVESIKNHCLKHLSKFKIPKYFQFVSEIPKNASGKVDRKSLKH